MTDVARAYDISSDIAGRASKLHHSIGSIGYGPCALDLAEDYASHKLTRAGVSMYHGNDPQHGICNEVAWFPPDDDAVFPGHACLSALLTTDGSISPSSSPVGWVQVHRDVVVWIGWRDDENLYTDWKDVYCSGLHLGGQDQHGNYWGLHYNLYWAGMAPTWPDWLLDGAAAGAHPPP